MPVLKVTSKVLSFTFSNSTSTFSYKFPIDLSFLYLIFDITFFFLQAFKLNSTECTNIAKAFKSNDFSTFKTNGVQCEGTNYQFLREDEGLVMGKRKDCGAVTLAATKTGKAFLLKSISFTSVYCFNALIY